MTPADTCNSRTQSTPTDQRAALLAWLGSCPPAELREVLASLPFKRLQQLHELHEFDPPTDEKASLALSQEARTAVLAARAAKGLSLWNPADAIHHREKLQRVGRVVTRRRNGSIDVGELQRVDYTPPDDDDRWNTAAELAADQAALRNAQPQEQGATHEDDHTDSNGKAGPAPAGEVD